MQPNENVSLSSCDAWKKIGPNDVCQTVDFDLTFLRRTIFLLHAMMIKFWHRFGWKLKIIIFTSTSSVQHTRHFNTHLSLPNGTSTQKTQKKTEKAEVTCRRDWFVWKWQFSVVVKDFVEETDSCGIDKFVYNSKWRIFGAEKDWPLCGSDFYLY